MAVERARTVPLRTAVWMALGSAAFVGAFFAGVLVARARPEPGGGTAEPLSFAGTLKRGGQAMSGRQSLTFTLRKGEVTCSAGPVEVEVDGEGHFTAPIPLGAPGGCPAGFFDGSDVVLEVGVAGETFTGPVNPVPYAKYAEQVGTPDCPAGYERDAAAGPRVICKRSVSGTVVDEVVRVGSRTSAFWVDRYEATVWPSRDDTGTTGWGNSEGDYPSSFPKNGQWTTDEPPVYALSKPGVMPSVFLTWFQSNEACRASGKRLPTGDEWLAASRGTVDPGNSDGAGGTCNTNAGTARKTGEGTACRSSWGAEDMVGNVWEATADWYAGLNDIDNGSTVAHAWPDPLYNDDIVYNVTSYAQGSTGATTHPGLPGAAYRGGYFAYGTQNGIFALLLNAAPSGWSGGLGFRCAMSR